MSRVDRRKSGMEHQVTLSYTERKGLEAWMQENKEMLIEQRPNLIDVARIASVALQFTVTYADVASMRKHIGLKWKRRIVGRKAPAKAPAPKEEKDRVASLEIAVDLLSATLKSLIIRWEGEAHLPGWLRDPAIAPAV